MTKLKNIVLAAISLVIFSNITHAQSLKAGYSVSSEEPLKVKYLGTDDVYLHFEVTMQLQSSSKAVFAVEEKNEGELYSSLVRNNYKVQTVKIEKGSYDALNFKLVVGKKTYSKSFAVNTSLVESTLVTASDITKL